MNSPRWIGLLALAVVLATLAGWWVLRTAPDAATSTAGHDAATPGASSAHNGARAASAACVFAPGQRLALAGRDTNEVELDLGGLFEGAGATQSPGVGLQMPEPRRNLIEHRWTLELEVLEIADDDGSAVLAAQLAQLDTTVDGRPVGGDAGDALGEVGAPFLVRVGADCAIREYGWRADAERRGVYNQQSLVSELVWSHPGDTRREVEGFDLTGRYRAIYRREGRGAVVGRTLRYDEVHARQGSPQRLGQTTRLRDSGVRVELSDEGRRWFDALRRHRTLEFIVRDQPVGSLRIEVEVGRRAPSSEPMPELPSPDDAGWLWGTFLDRSKVPPTRGRQAHDSEHADLERVSVDDALSAFIAMTERGSGHSPSDYVNFMRDWLRVHPEALPEILARIERGELKDLHTARAGLFLALGLADTPQTRDALMTIFAGPDFKEGYRIQAARALLEADPPPVGYFERLLADANEGPARLERGSMQLVTGTFARRHADAHPDLAAAARGQIEGWLEQAADDPDPVAAMHALQSASNASHESLADDIGAYLEHDDTEVRATAVDALRTMPPEVAMPMLEDVVAADASEAVRTQALATAAEVARLRQHPVSPALLSYAADHIGQTSSQVEFEVMTELLGQAAGSGDARARQAIEQQFAAEMARADKDLARLERLGRHRDNHWKAP